ncbi:MAG: ABC transporter permease [Gammaproteobacteria bacterium]|nr:MAG: ABC transporter permease [Gammaproteobacteria bacterium]
MSTGIHPIGWWHLAVAFVPALVTLVILWRWSLGVRRGVVALLRMLVQLVLIGYFLAWIFGAASGWVILLVLSVMLFASSWIALGTVPGCRRTLFGAAFLSILVGGGLTLALITQGVLSLDPWYLPQYMIPLAGMIFSNSMNSVSLSAERMDAELDRQPDYETARRIAFNASLIPVINSLLAVGLVSLPGMMTGQILSGVSPLIAARYQIMVMAMIFGSAGISTAIFLQMSRPLFEARHKDRLARSCSA